MGETTGMCSIVGIDDASAICTDVVDNGDPYIAETKVIGGFMDGFKKIYNSKEEAEEGHDKVMDMVLASRGEKMNLNNIDKILKHIEEVPSYIADAVQNITRKLTYITELQWGATVRDNKRYRVGEIEQLITHLKGMRCVANVAIEQLEEVITHIKKEEQ